MLPAGPLMIEHRLIERMLVQMRKEKEGIERGREPDRAFLAAAVDFFRTYADRCHHGKEEGILFASLAAKDLPPEMALAMARLKDEHVRARELVGMLERSVMAADDGADRSMAAVLGEIASLYPDHIAREDKEFFPAAMAHLDGREREEMLRRFEDFDRRLIHERYRAIVEGAEKR